MAVAVAVAVVVAEAEAAAAEAGLPAPLEEGQSFSEALFFVFRLFLVEKGEKRDKRDKRERRGRERSSFSRATVTTNFFLVSLFPPLTISIFQLPPLQLALFEFEPLSTYFFPALANAQVSSSPIATASKASRGAQEGALQRS